MTNDPRVERLLTRFIEHHVARGEELSARDLCAEEPDLLEPLQKCIRRYLALDQSLDRGLAEATPAPPTKALPFVEGFEVIERIGGGGAGEVFKLRDTQLNRIVAGKMLRSDAQLSASLQDFLREAQAMALFQDSRIVQVHEFRADADPAVIIMEYVDGFQLDQIGPSLEYSQRARIIKEVCEALEGAHARGLQHRDLKPANIMLDSLLQPKLLDFGLSQNDPHSGHFRGTPHYVAPEQLDPSLPIDNRTDIYSLGVIFYELLCGSLPGDARSGADRLAQPGQVQLMLPVEIDAGVPEPLQAIALKAMDHDPAKRYASVREMALDLNRYLDGQPVLARPELYSAALGRRVQQHVEQVGEWLRLKLIYPHEARRLQTGYRKLEARDDDWIVEGRTLSYSQIALYLGSLLLLVGGLLYFAAHRFFDAASGWLEPFLVLGLPCVGLSVAGHFLYRKEHKAVAVAFVLGAVLLLPLLLLMLFHEARWWLPIAGDEAEFFSGESISNRQLQVALLASSAWALVLALRTRTTALSTVFTVLAFFSGLALLTDLGLRTWIDEGRWDLLSLHLVPMLLLTAVGARRMEARSRTWFARPLYVGSAVLLVLVLELVALNGRAFRYLGLSLRGFQSPDVSDPILLDTMAAMTVAGILFYVTATVLERWENNAVAPAAFLLFILSPFAILEPIAYLNSQADYSRSFDWAYLGLALAVVFLSHHRQRRTFYLAGLINTVVALWLITDHYEWFDRPGWAVVVVAIGLLTLGAGLGLHRLERSRQRVVSGNASSL